jgi:hypothetical protein
MNSKQRRRNRSTARALHLKARAAQLAKHTCENCMKPGGHWVSFGRSLEDIFNGTPDTGQWLCQKDSA